MCFQMIEYIFAVAKVFERLFGGIMAQLRVCFGCIALHVKLRLDRIFVLCTVANRGSLIGFTLVLIYNLNIIIDRF